MNQTPESTTHSDRGLPVDINGIRDAILLVEANSRIVRYCNRSAERVFGYPAEDLVGHTTEHLHVDAEHYRFFGGDSRPKLDELDYFKCRFNMRRRDGTPFPSTNMVMPTSGMDGTPMAVSVVRDDSECLQQIAEKDALIEEVASCAADTRDLQSVLRRVLGSLCRYFQWDGGDVWMPANGELTLQASWRLADDQDRDTNNVSRSRGLIASMVMGNRVSDSGRPEWRRWDSGERPAAGSEQLRAVCGVPVCVQGDLFAVAVFSTRRDRERDLAAQGLMEYIWALLGPTLRDLAVVGSAASASESSGGGEITVTHHQRGVPGRADMLALLTPRESEVAELMVDGLLTKEIAHRLQLSPRTVDSYRAALKRKLQARSLPKLVATLGDLLPSAYH